MAGWLEQARTGEGLGCLPVQLACVSGSLQLGDFAGPLWRSGFGLALKRQLPALFDLLFAEQASTLAGEQWFSKGQNCPFLGHCLPGRVRYTLLDGRISYQA